MEGGAEKWFRLRVNYIVTGTEMPIPIPIVFKSDWNWTKCIFNYLLIIVFDLFFQLHRVIFNSNDSLQIINTIYVAYITFVCHFVP